MIYEAIKWDSDPLISAAEPRTVGRWDRLNSLFLSVFPSWEEERNESWMQILEMVYFYYDEMPCIDCVFNIFIWLKGFCLNTAAMTLLLGTTTENNKKIQILISFISTIVSTHD